LSFVALPGIGAWHNAQHAWVSPSVMHHPLAELLHVATPVASCSWGLHLVLAHAKKDLHTGWPMKAARLMAFPPPPMASLPLCCTVTAPLLFPDRVTHMSVIPFLSILDPCLPLLQCPALSLLSRGLTLGVASAPSCPLGMGRALRRAVCRCISSCCR
jgi:hypothetical protein